MQLNLIVQKNEENKFADKLAECFNKNPKKAYFFFGELKDSGFRILEDYLIDSKVKLSFIIGIDKKNTTKLLLENILEYSKDVYYYSNNAMREFNSNICIFEYTNEAYLYICTANMSENGIAEDLTIYSEYIYDLKNKEEKASYKEQLKNILKVTESEEFHKLDKVEIDKLVEEKEIFTTRQYNHSVKSISEFLGKSTAPAEPKKEMSRQEIDDVYVQDKEIPKVDLSDISLDIDMSSLEEMENVARETKKESETKKKELDVTYNENDFNQMANLEEVKELIDNSFEKEQEQEVLDKNNELYDESMLNDDFDDEETIDLNEMLFSKADVKLEVPTKPKKKKVEEEIEDKVQVKKLNLNNISNFIFELPARPQREEDCNLLKIPNYIRTMIPEFFELNDKAKNVEINGSMYKVRKIKIETVDVKTGIKYTDREAKIMLKAGQTYLTFSSDTFKNIIYAENDIVRMIKLANDIYHIEFISSDMEEYKLWDKICTQNFKSSTRKYGMM